MELRHLRYFVAIAEERSFTRAAERLWVAQPGLSTQIRRLESELGVQLFERHTRGVDLTDAGELFLERARTALAAADAARSTGHDLGEGLVGSVRLGIVTGAGWPGTSALLGHFGRERPAVELTVVEAYGGTLLCDLRDGRFDAIIAPSEFGSAELPWVCFGREFWLVNRWDRLRLYAQLCFRLSKQRGVDRGWFHENDSNWRFGFSQFDANGINQPFQGVLRCAICALQRHTAI